MSNRFSGLAARLAVLSQHVAHQEGSLAAASRLALGSRYATHLHLRGPSRFLSTAGPDEYKKQMVDRSLLVDTLDLAKAFEQSGLPRDAAEKLAMRITELIVTNKVKMEETFVKQVVLEKTILEQESKIMSFKNELSKTQDMHVASVNKDMDRQQSYLDKMKAEVRHEIDKLSASQRLDMNLEKGRMRDDLQAIRDKTTELHIMVDKDINELRSSVEKAKNDTIKSVITILGTFSAIAFTISRFVQMSSGG